MNVSKNEPVAPSAKYQSTDGVVAPAAAPPPLHGRVAVEPKYIARSATTGCVASTMMPNERLTSSGIVAAEIVLRENGASCTVVVTAASPSRRNVSVTSTGSACGLPTSTNVSNQPCEPSANSQRVAGAGAAFSV